MDSPDGPIEVNEYYARHPEMMLGMMKLEGTMYRGAEPTLSGTLTPELLTPAVRALPEAMQRYKSLLPIRAALLAWLDARSATESPGAPFMAQRGNACTGAENYAGSARPQLTERR